MNTFTNSNEELPGVYCRAEECVYNTGAGKCCADAIQVNNTKTVFDVPDCSTFEKKAKTN